MTHDLNWHCIPPREEERINYLLMEKIRAEEDDDLYLAKNLQREIETLVLNIQLTQSFN